MRTRAAVAVAAGKPLEIMEVNLDGPRKGEVLVEIKATGLCHTDEFTRSGDDPEGIFPAILGHEGAGDRDRSGRGGHHARSRGPRYPALHARVPRMRILSEPQNQPVPEKCGPRRDRGCCLTGPPGSPCSMARRSTTTWAARHSPTTQSCLKSRWPKCARTRRLTKSATSGAASPQASAR